MELSEYLNERLTEEFPSLLRHLEENSLVVTQGIFTGHFMTFGMNNCPVEIATRLFEMFILDLAKLICSLRCEPRFEYY